MLWVLLQAALVLGSVKRDEEEEVREMGPLPFIDILIRNLLCVLNPK